MKLDVLTDLAKIAAKCGDSKFNRGDAVLAGVKGSRLQYMKAQGLIETDRDNGRLMYITEYGYRQLTEVEKLANFIAKNVA